MPSKGTRHHHNTPPYQHHKGGPGKPPPQFRDQVAHLSYPSRPKRMILEAQGQHLPPDAVRLLHRIPDHEYRTPDEVYEAARKAHEI